MDQMAAEERNGGYSHQQGGSSAVELSFDELARELAGGVSRRKALKLLGGALVGAVLASVPGVAWAAKGGNSACAKFCRENFPPGRERGECIRAGERGEGPCFEDGTECVSDELTCFTPESSSGCHCVANECTFTVTCVCCPPGGPCPCLEVDETDPCTGPQAVSCDVENENETFCSSAACPPGIT
jgi:hypothetical protein